MRVCRLNNERSESSLVRNLKQIMQFACYEILTRRLGGGKISGSFELPAMENSCSTGVVIHWWGGGDSLEGFVGPLINDVLSCVGENYFRKKKMAKKCEWSPTTTTMSHFLTHLLAYRHCQ